MFYDNSGLVIQLFTGVECSMISEFVIQAVGLQTRAGSPFHGSVSLFAEVIARSFSTSPNDNSGSLSFCLSSLP